jgi:hypothetical protein
MLEIKVQCDCGQKYKFDVEPVHGRMPFVVNCPVCGQEGTGKANQILSQVVVPPAAPVPMASPIRVGALPLGGLPLGGPPRPSAPSLRISGLPGNAGSVPAAVAPAVAMSTASTAIAPAPLPASGIGKAVRATQATPGKKPSFALGMTGAAVGALVGSTIYFLIFYYSGLRLKLLAIGVGYLAGLGAELLGRKEGSKELGMIAAVFTLVGIVGAQYFVARHWWNFGEALRNKESSYEANVAEAKKVVAAVPTGSDQEIRIYLAKEDADAGEKPDPKSVGDDEIKDFRETTLPHMRELASGKVTKEEFDKQHQAHEAENKADQLLSDEGTFKAIFLLLLLSKLNLFSLAAAAGLAFKVCSNA